MLVSYNLNRYLEAQNGLYPQVLEELGRGRKQGHWMWFVFPQMRGLGQSQMAYRFGIESLDEANAYLAHPVLGARLKECAQLLVDAGQKDAEKIFAYPDNLKLRSSMTLFAAVDTGNSIFQKVLQQYFSGVADEKTLALIGV